MTEFSGDRLISSITLSKRRSELVEKKFTKHSLIWPLFRWDLVEDPHDVGREILQSGHWLPVELNQKHRLGHNQRPSDSVEVKVPRNHLNHCPATMCNPLTCAALNITLSFELQLRNTFQAFDEFRCKPTVQSWDKT